MAITASLAVGAGALASGTGALGIAAAVGAGVGGGLLLKKATSGGKSNEQGIQSPQAPNPLAIQADEKKKAQQKAAGRTGTVYTSPLGINDSNLNTEKKSLLGG